MRSPVSVFGLVIFGLLTFYLLDEISPLVPERSITILWIISSTYIALLSLVCVFFYIPNKLFYLLGTLPVLLVLGRFFYFDWNHANLLNQLEMPSVLEISSFIAMIIWLLILGRLNNDDIMC